MSYDGEELIPATPQAIEVPPGLVAAIAAGLEDPKEIAARFGIDGETWERLTQWKPFLDAVKAQQAEFESSGFTFRVKSAMKADILSDQLFVLGMSNEATLPQKMELLKTFAKLGDLEPKPAAQNAQQGAKFSITINMSGDRPEPKTIDITPVPEKLEADE